MAGARACARRPLTAASGFLVLGAVMVGGALAPWINLLFLLIALPPIAGACPALALALVDGRRHPLRWALRRAFRRYQRCLSLFWLGYLMLIFLAAPLFIAIYAADNLLPPTGDTWALGIGAVLTAILQILVLHPYILVPWLALDRA